MAHEDKGRGCLIANLEEQFQKSLAAIRIERRGRLIGDHEPGSSDHRSRNGDPLLLASTYSLHALIENRIDIKTVCDSGRLLLESGREDSGAPGMMYLTWKLNVFADGEIWDQIEALKYVAHLRATVLVTSGGGKLRQIPSENFATAPPGLQNACDQPKQRRLAAAAWSVQEDPSSFFYAKTIYMENVTPGLVAKDDILHADRVRHLPPCARVCKASR